MAAEVAIRITADGKAVVVAAKLAETALQGIDAQAGKTGQALQGATKSSEGLEAAMRALQASSQGYVAQLAANKTQLEGMGAQLAAVRAEVDQLKDKLGRNTPVLPGVVPGLEKVQISAKQTAAALRGVPAQFTDIVTSLQGGQAPLTVFLQQGGQLKDMFGGAGNAAKALGGYVMGLVNPFTVGAALVGGLAFAYEKGAQESRAFQNAVTMSGNAVGLSASQFGAMTQSLSSMAGTRGKAAEALTEIATTGKLAGAEIKNIAEAAILMEKATGQAVGDTIKEFAKLADEPVKASLALNKQYNYLTAAVYEQIKALEEQGNKLGAAELAEKTYADALKARASTVIDNAGLMERAWRGITGAAKGAWDAMLGVGREASLQDKLASVGKEIAKAQGPFNASAFGDGNAEAKAKLQANLQLQASLQEMVRLEKRGTEAANERGQAQQRTLDAKVNFEKLQDQFARNSEKRTKALAIAEREGLAAGKSPEDIETVLAGIRKNYKDSAPKKERIDENAKLIASVRESVAATEAELALDQKLTPVQKDIATLYEKISSSKKHYILETLLTVDALMQEALANEDANLTREAARKATEDANKERQKSLDTLIKETATLEDQIRKQQDQNAGIGLTKEAVAALTAQRELDKASTLEALAIKELDRNLDYQQYDATMAKVAAMRQLAAAQKTGGTLQTAEDEAKKADAAWKKTATSIENTLTESLMRSFEKGQSFAKTARDTIVNMFKTMVLRPIVSAIMTPVSSAIGNTLGISGAANAGGVGGIANMASSANSLYSTGSSLFSVGSQYAAGTMSGANAAGTLYANATGGGLDALLSSNAAYGTAVSAGSEALVASNAALGVELGLETASASAAASAAAAAGGSTAAATGTLLGMGPAGWAALAAVAAFAIFSNKGKPTASTGDSQISFDANGQESSRLDLTKASFKATASVDADNVVRGMRDSYLAAAKALGIQAGASTFGYGGNTGKGGEHPSLTVTGGVGASTYNSGEIAATKEALSLEASRVLLTALQGSELPKYLSGVFDGLTASAMTQEQIEYVLNGAQAFATLHKQLKALPFQDLTDLSFATTKALIAASGGLEQLGANLSAYYDGFYSTEEKRAQTIKRINEETAGSGFDAATASDAAFRALVEGQDLLTDAGVKNKASLLSVAGAFYALGEGLRALKLQSAGLEADLLRASGNTAGADAAQYVLDTAGLSNAERAIYDYNAGLKKQIDVFTSLKSLGADALTLQIELMRLQGKTGEADYAQRLIDTKGMGAAEIAIYDYNAGLKDQITTLTSLKSLGADAVTLQIELMRLQGKTGEADYAQRLIDTKGMGAAEIAIYDYNAALRTQIAIVREGVGLQDRLNALTDTAAQALTRQRDALDESNRPIFDQITALEAVAKVRTNLIDAYTQEASAMQSTVDRFRTFSKDLRAFRDGLLLGSLSPLTPGQRYAQASSQFDKTLSAALGGDEAAMGKLQGASTALLEASKLYNASSGAYVSDFARVQDALGNSAISAAATADVAQLQLDAAKSQLSLLGSIDKGVMSVADALTALAEANAASSALGGSVMSTGGMLAGSQAYSQAWMQGEIKSNLAAGYSAQQIISGGASNYGLTETEIRKAARAAGIPGFAVGTNYVPHDMLAQIHEGEAIVPRAYNPAAGAQGQSNAALEAKLEAVLAELRTLREQNNQGHAMNAQATVTSSAKNADTVTARQSKAAWSKQPELA